MYLSERINWIISSFPRWISKTLFVLGSWDHFESLRCKIGEFPLFYVSILFLSSVHFYIPRFHTHDPFCNSIEYMAFCIYNPL